MVEEKRMMWESAMPIRAARPDEPTRVIPFPRDPQGEREPRRRLMMAGRASSGRSEIWIEPASAPAVGPWRLSRLVLER
ncbi:MAG: hypothetical protein O7E50_01990 [Gemmatimonadetes bacterium]|nr:hypothetical protein [Gemmatimonadota bacterium]